jgi:pectin methylesterase-like acyl-CoA thioesterase
VLLRIGALTFAAMLPACTSPPPDSPPNVAVGMTAMPRPPVEPNDARPQILAMRFSTLDVQRSSRWSGAFVTGTNVASLEVRTNLFSINVPKRSPGRFSFVLDVLDAPPIFVRAYRLRVIARNSAGDAYEEDVPLRIR